MHKKPEAPEKQENEVDAELCMVESEIGEITKHSSRIYDASGKVLISPRPSNALEDPLNMLLWKKWVFLVALSVWSGVALSSQSFFASFLPQIQERFPAESTSNINLLFTINGPLIAPADILLFISAGMFGTRPTFLVAMLIFVISNILAAASTTYTALLVSRILNGIATAPTDALQFYLLEKTVFVHERGLFLALINSVGGTLQLLLNIASSYVATLVGMSWAFAIYSILSGICLIIFWLTMPELNYARDPDNLAIPMSVEEHQIFAAALHKESQLSHLHFSPLATGKDQLEARTTLSHNLGILLSAVSSPAVWWMGACQTVFFGGYSAMCNYYSSMLQSPPWSWPAQNVSLINFIAVPLGGLL
ncbi:hypothetical protein N7520_005522 [Penicillium odoratum]|uniref:uncharacterized protein n=1 Tax=Penicillium odoratum TaxID=1167516 RepID=UPI002549AEC5|nr:uncharacterized protein N7520_005522 [Penicillium odoratum]KAJ5758366.1 hypothetical protein N7520_005522 [Penicillium odoratum]